MNSKNTNNSTKKNFRKINKLIMNKNFLTSTEKDQKVNRKKEYNREIIYFMKDQMIQLELMKNI